MTSLMQATSESTFLVPGSQVRSTVRIAAYWLCITLLLWPGIHPLAEWRLVTTTSFLAASSLVVTALGCTSSVLHGYLSSLGLTDPGAHDHGLFTHKFFHTGFIAVEILLVLTVALALERLLL
ncbi:MAG: hypothetical protein AB7T07_11280 [Steroidobacteraceae bacterium]